jgi:hypothetical protein
MIDVLNSVMLKYDPQFKSLTKRALAQIILKIIYQYHSTGITSKSIRATAENFTSVSFSSNDIDDAIIHLRNAEKIHSKENRHFLKEDTKKNLDKIVSESEKSLKEIISYYFGKSDAYCKEGGEDKLILWFNKLMISFFKEYRYDWINDLRQRKVHHKRKTFNIDKLISSSFDKIEINEKDKNWLKEQFLSFLDSERVEDNELLWRYGSSMFSATLLTARNYVDNFSIDIFNESYFVLDTNILMTLGLEGHELAYAFKPIENVFQKLKIVPVYFYISKEEYRRAVNNKRNATYAALDKFGFDIIKETECGILKTALKRQCVKKEDFEEFFNQIESVPEVFCENLKLQLLDYEELHDKIEEGQLDEDTAEKLNEINYSRSRHYKSDNVLRHDTGLIQGALFLNDKKRTWILTKDGTVRTYANETALRNDDPIAIGLDSFIQMMAINNGNIECNSTNFAPLFAKLVQFSLWTEKDMFKMEDLFFIHETNIDIQDLPKDNILEIAKKVNKLRILNKPDDEIALEIRRYFQKTKIDFEAIQAEIESEKNNLQQHSSRISSQRDNLENSLFEAIFSKKRSRLIKKIAWNWAKLIFIPIMISAIIFFAYKLSISNNNKEAFLAGVLVEVAATIISFWRFDVKLKISKEDIEELKTRTIEDIERVKNKKN